MIKLSRSHTMLRLDLAVMAVISLCLMVELVGSDAQVPQNVQSLERIGSIWIDTCCKS